MKASELNRRMGKAKNYEGYDLGPLVQVIGQEDIEYSDFTDGGGAAGTCALNTIFGTPKIPAGAIVLGWFANIKTAFACSATCVLTVGDGSTATAFDRATAQSLATVALVGGSALDTGDANTNATSVVTTETGITLTATEDSDFGDVTAGKMDFFLFYVKCPFEACA